MHDEGDQRVDIFDRHGSTILDGWGQLGRFRARPLAVPVGAAAERGHHRRMPWEQRGSRVTKLWSNADRTEQSHRARLRAVPVEHSPAALLAKPAGKLHPLAFLILDRGVSVMAAAKHLGVDHAVLARVIAWRSPAVEPMRSRVAAALGVEADALFPAPPTTRATFE